MNWFGKKKEKEPEGPTMGRNDEGRAEDDGRMVGNWRKRLFRFEDVVLDLSEVAAVCGWTAYLKDGREICIGVKAVEAVVAAIPRLARKGGTNRRTDEPTKGPTTKGENDETKGAAEKGAAEAAAAGGTAAGGEGAEPWWPGNAAEEQA